MSPRSRGTAALAEAQSVFSALGDRTRLRLVARLSAGGPQSISRLAAGSNVTRQAIAKHLEVLAGARLARGVPRGRERIWELDAARLEQARSYLENISKGWDAALDRLRNFVEE